MKLRVVYLGFFVRGREREVERRDVWRVADRFGEEAMRKL